MPIPAEQMPTADIMTEVPENIIIIMDMKPINIQTVFVLMIIMIEQVYPPAVHLLAVLTDHL